MSIQTIQPSFQSPPQAVPLVELQIAAPPGLRMASERAKENDASNSFVEVATRFDRSELWKLGSPIVSRMAVIATTTISSISENPRCRIPPPLPVRTGAIPPYPWARGLQGRSGWAVDWRGRAYAGRPVPLAAGQDPPYG